VATGTPSAQQPATPLRFRRSAEKLTAGQLRALRDAFTKVYPIADERGYQFHAGIHGYPLPAYCDMAHGHPEYFLPWHRAYLYFFERALRAQNADAALPWWDWTSSGSQATGIPKAYADKQAGTKPNPLYSSKVNPVAVEQGKKARRPRPAVTERFPGQPGTNPLPTATWLTRLIENHPDFTDFSSRLERVHGDVHVWVGGHMSDIGFAAYDPIFWAHHTMIDRVWSLWQLRWGKTPPAAALDQALSPFPMTVRQTLSIHALGYEYAGSSAHSPAGPVR
jgi:tyrosinase